eukprot:403349400
MNLDFPPQQFNLIFRQTSNDRVYGAMITNTFILNTAVYVLAQFLKDNGIVEIAFGPIFVLGLIAQLQIVQNFHERSILVFILLIAWATRLSINNYQRRNGENWKYAEMREKWMKAGRCFYYMKAFMLIYIPYSIWEVLLNFSALFVTIYTRSGINYFDVIGFAIWGIGFIIELVADNQLMNFRKNVSNKGKLLTTGLWRYSRHPNYFGEILMWWGIYIIACQVYLGFITVFSPVLMTIRLRFMTGVPIVEQRLGDRIDFIEYKKQTNCLVPWFQKKIAISEPPAPVDLEQTSRVRILNELDSVRQDSENPDQASFMNRRGEVENNFQNSFGKSLKPTVKVQPSLIEQIPSQFKLKSPIQNEKVSQNNNKAMFSLDSFVSDESFKNSKVDPSLLRVNQQSKYLSDSKISNINIKSPRNNPRPSQFANTFDNSDTYRRNISKIGRTVILSSNGSDSNIPIQTQRRSQVQSVVE